MFMTHATTPRGIPARRATVIAAAVSAAVLLLGGCGTSAAGAAQAEQTTVSGDAAPNQITEPTNPGGSGAAGDSGTGGTSDGSSGGSAGAPGAGGSGPGGGNLPVASGLIAAVQKQSFQVQDSSSQTTVRYTDSTEISQTVAGSLADIQVGSCVTAIAAADTSTDGSDQSAPPTGSTGGAPNPMAPTELTAATVTIRAAVDGSCQGFGLGNGLGGGDRGFPQGQLPGGGTPPSGAPGSGQGAPGSGQGAPGSGQGFPGGDGSGAPGQGRGNVGGFGGLVSGRVTAVDGSTITVSVTGFQRPTGDGTTGSAEATTSTVTVTGDTSYQTTKAATPEAIAVGQCATAVGTADDSGAIDATSIELSEAQNGSCRSGFGGLGGFPGRGQTSAPETTHG